MTSEHENLVMRHWTLFGLIVLCMLARSAPTRAQGFGKIVGTVSDPSGAVIPNAKLTATEAGKGFSRTASTDSDGYFVLDSLRPAQYDLTIEATGFHTFVQKAVTLLTDQTLTLNVNLQVGSVTATVSVVAGNSQVDTSTPTIKQVIELSRIAELPSNGRNVAELTLSIPGSSGFANAPNPTSGTAGGALQGATKTFPGAVAIAVNGSRQNQISYQLDGGNYVDEYTNVNQPFPMPDALQEFSVQTSNYSAEYGQNAGAVVNVITRSGANNFHGDVFEFVRNAVFNARGFFAPFTLPNGQPTKDKGRDQIKRNQFGGTVGGPIIHDKTFFFAGYQGTRFRNIGNASRSTLPSTNFAPNAIPASGPVTSSTTCTSGTTSSPCDIETY